MNCLSDEMLRAGLDGEWGPVEAQEAEKHLALCAACGARRESISRGAEIVRGAMSTLTPLAGEAPMDAGIAYARMRAEMRSEQEARPSLVARLLGRRWHPLWALAAFAGVLIVAMSFAPAQSWAQRLLALLRVQKITVLPIDTAAMDFSSLDGGRISKMLGQVISDDVVVTRQPGEPQSVARAEQASELAGFKVRLPSTLTDAPQLMVAGESAFHMNVHRDRLQAILDEAGRPDIELPSALEGATISVHIPKGVWAGYGNCGKLGKKHGADNDDIVRAKEDYVMPGEASGCVMLIQIPSPTVSVPPNLNIAQIAEAALQLAGMNPTQAHTFCQTVDWTSTLVVPLPRSLNSYQTANVDGVEGTVVDLPAGRRQAAGYSVMWVKNGVIYSLSGAGSTNDGLELASTLR